MRSIRSFRLRCATKYLDWAEMLPKFHGGVFRRLQYLRERHRLEAKKAYEATRPAEGVSLHFDQLLMVEMFLIEDYEELERQLRRFFSSGRSLNETLRQFSVSAQDLFAGRWSVIGHIIRKKASPSFYPLATASLPTLPEEVKRIEVHISKVLPSFFAVSFHVYLSEEATKKVQSLLNQSYLPELAFGGILPTRHNLSRWSALGSEQVMRKEVIRSFITLRLKIEQQLRTKIRGIFLQSSENLRPRLPALEMLSLEGIPPDAATSMLDQLKDSARWADCFGFKHWRTNHLFSGKGMLFHWAEDDDGKIVPFRLLTFRNSSTPDRAEEDRQFQFDDIGGSLTPLIAVLGFVESTRGKVEKLRISVYRILAGKMSFRRLRSEIRLNNRMQLHQMILSRLRFEMTDSRWNLNISAQELADFEAADRKENRTLARIIREV